LIDAILPFGGVVHASGRVLHLSRSLSKVLNLSQDEVDFFELFQVQTPRRLRKTTQIADLIDQRVTLTADIREDEKPLVLRAHLSAWDSEGQVFVLNTSFGINLTEAVDQYQLTDQDFSHADSSIDMLYVLKTQAALLSDSHAMAERLKQARDAAEELALSDALTGLPNRRALTQFLDSWIEETRTEQKLAILHVDLDRFKHINDTLGHAAGDQVLMRVSEVLKAQVGTGEMSARIGGDEFVLVLKADERTKAQIEHIAREATKTLSKPFKVGRHNAQIGASIGITMAQAGHDRTVDDYLLEADLALYEVKGNGRGCVHFYDSALSSKQALIQSLTRDLEPAIVRGQFKPFYQLQIDSRSGRIYGAEVLGRWLHPEHGLLTPATFLVISERAKLTEQIDHSIFIQALDHFQHWKAQGLDLPHLSFNITADKLVDEDFLAFIEEETDRRGLMRSQVMFELIEAILIDSENDKLCQAVQKIADAGFRVALDDFGTGRASISSLISVPVHLVKIDRSFVTGLHQDEKLQLLTRSIAQLCSGLKIEVLAEGVELKEEAKALSQLGCWRFQGYLFSRPLPPVQFEQMLKQVDWPLFLEELDLVEDWPTRDQLLKHANLI